MKKIILIAGTLFLINTVSAQHLKEEEVPEIIKQSFAKKYPTSKVETWEKEGAEFEAEFYLNKIESSALFDAKGNSIELEQEIKIAELPKAATEFCNKTYVGYKIEEASKITDASGKINYEAEMEKGKEQFDVIFDEKGNFLKKLVSSPKNEKKD